jgi:hypothetical protein
MASVQFTEDDKKIIDEHPVKSPFLDAIFMAITSKANAQGMKFKPTYLTVF